MYLTSNTLDCRLCIIRLSPGWQLNFSPCMKDIVLGMTGKLPSFSKVHILGKSRPNINRILWGIRTVNSSQCCSSSTDLVRAPLISMTVPHLSKIAVHIADKLKKHYCMIRMESYIWCKNLFRSDWNTSKWNRNCKLNNQNCLIVR